MIEPRNEMMDMGLSRRPEMGLDPKLAVSGT